MLSAARSATPSWAMLARSASVRMVSSVGDCCALSVLLVELMQLSMPSALEGNVEDRTELEGF